MNSASASAVRRSPAWTVAEVWILRPSTRSTRPRTAARGATASAGGSATVEQTGHARPAGERLGEAEHLVEGGSDEPAVDAPGRALVGVAEHAAADDVSSTTSNSNGRRQRVRRAGHRAEVDEAPLVAGHRRLGVALVRAAARAPVQAGVGLGHQLSGALQLVGGCAGRHEVLDQLAGGLGQRRHRPAGGRVAVAPRQRLGQALGGVGADRRHPRSLRLSHRVAVQVDHERRVVRRLRALAGVAVDHAPASPARPRAAWRGPGRCACRGPGGSRRRGSPSRCTAGRRRASSRRNTSSRPQASSVAHGLALGRRHVGRAGEGRDVPDVAVLGGDVEVAADHHRLVGRAVGREVGAAAGRARPACTGSARGRGPGRWGRRR